MYVVKLFISRSFLQRQDSMVICNPLCMATLAVPHLSSQISFFLALRYFWVPSLFPVSVHFVFVFAVLILSCFHSISSLYESEELVISVKKCFREDYIMSYTYIILYCIISYHVISYHISTTTTTSKSVSLFLTLHAIFFSKLMFIGCFPSICFTSIEGLRA